MRWGPENERKGVQEHYGGENEAPRAMSCHQAARTRVGGKSMPVYFERRVARGLSSSQR